MPRFQTANPKVVPYLYHWQRFVPDHLTEILRNRVIWCSDPATFNDPLTCLAIFGPFDS